MAMPTHRGAPTPPIAFGDGPIGDHVRAQRVEVSDALATQIEATGATVSRDAETIAEASRDWWPLAMHWALLGAGP